MKKTIFLVLLLGFAWSAVSQAAVQKQKNDEVVVLTTFETIR